MMAMVRAMRDFVAANRRFDPGRIGHGAIRMVMVVRETLRRRSFRCAGLRGISFEGAAHVIYRRRSRLYCRGSQGYGFSVYACGQRAALVRDAAGESIDRGAGGSGKLIVRAGHMRSMHRDRNE